ncbi:MAG TPA: hypothetical protein P5307_29110 [Pirellulaceae bacterium]|nr:hypothetical protein [Pirellulaceae bacterium]
MTQSTLDERWLQYLDRYGSCSWENRHLPDDQAETAILHLYHQLDQYDCISGWVGPVYRYGGGFERFLDLSATDDRSQLLRDGALVMVLFATWCAAEEMYVLSESDVKAFRTRVDRLLPQSEQHERLLATAAFALQLVDRQGMYHNWDQMTVFRLDRESRWIVENVVRPALRNGEPPMQQRDISNR